MHSFEVHSNENACRKSRDLGLEQVIIAATVLRFHDAFLGIIGDESSDKYKDPTHHPFHHKIISILAETKISIETFHKWQGEFVASFNKTIGWRLTFQKLAKVWQKGMSVVVVSLR